MHMWIPKQTNATDIGYTICASVSPAPLYPLQDFKALYKYCIIIIIIIIIIINMP